ncbi:MAG: carbohydrate ABC transporter permease [Spirochaetota bacterium]|nr:MAG: carbohydrate ABC transporter permease [Spirochaetota bacterium]
MKEMSKRTGVSFERATQKAIKQLLLIIVAFIALYPLYWLIITAFKTQADYLVNKFGLPWPIMIGNIVTALRGGRFARWFLNSTIITAGSTLAGTTIACLAAFAFAKMPFRGSNAILNFVISLMVVPPVVMIVPLFILYAQIGFTSTYQGIIVLYVGLTMPFSVYLLTNFFKTIPHDIVDSAMMDGCSHFGILWRIYVPLSAPALVTLIIVNALWIWNELLLALVFLPKDKMRTLMVGITAFRSRLNLDIPVTMAGLLLSTLPMIILYVVFQRFFIRGLTAGATKG